MGGWVGGEVPTAKCPTTYSVKEEECEITVRSNMTTKCLSISRRIKCDHRWGGRSLQQTFPVPLTQPPSRSLATGPSICHLSLEGRRGGGGAMVYTVVHQSWRPECVFE